MVSFEGKNTAILSASLKDARKQSTVEHYIKGSSMSERIVLFTSTICYQLLNHLFGHQIDLLLLIPMGASLGEGYIPASRSPGAKYGRRKVKN